MWPALALWLLVAAVFYWGSGVPPASAQAVQDVVVSRTTATVSEGDVVSYSLRLVQAPTGKFFVRPHLTAGGDHASVGPSLLVFDDSNWNVNQTVYFAAANDDRDSDIPNATVSYELRAADGTTPTATKTLVATINDDDARGISVSNTSLSVAEGDHVSYRVSLQSEPTGDVQVALSAAGPVPAAIRIVTPSPLTFTADNWHVPQTVLVRGQRDHVDGSDRSAAVSHALTGGDYDALSPSPNVTVSVRDDDVRGIVVSPERLAFREDGTGVYRVRLASKPTQPVMVSVSSADTAKATVSASSLSFTVSNWNQTQSVTVTGVRDNVAVVSRSVAISHSVSGTGSDYDGQSKSVPVSLVNVDPYPSSQLVVSPSALEVREGVSGTYLVNLSSAPASDVTVSLSSSDTAVARVAPSTLVFTSDNWSTARAVTVTGVDDTRRLEWARSAHIAHRVGGSVEYYVGVLVPDDDAQDDDAGVVISAAGTGLTIQEGSTGTYTVRLNRRPTGNVDVAVASSFPSAVSVSPSVLTFTALNWSDPQTVVALSVRDNVDTGNLLALVTHRVSGGGYDRLAQVGHVEVTVLDSDQRAVIVKPSLTSLQEGAAGGYSVRLGSKLDFAQNLEKV